jgi:sugar phosphate isomerase/epimerase
MGRPRPRITVFPKCFFAELCRGSMDYVQWIRDAAGLGSEGVEHYEGFGRLNEPGGVDAVRKALEETGQVSSMLCFSPDFTHPDPDQRLRQIERQKAAIDLCLALGTTYCRTLSGQAFPEISPAQGVAWTVQGIQRSLEYAEPRGVVLCMENHYKDGNWRYPEFAQREDVFLEIIEQIDSPNFGVQYDPSNAIVGGYDPIEFLEKVKHRVVTMHASDRHLAPGASPEDLRSADGAVGYSKSLVHGEIGRGLNDYDRIFSILSRIGYHGWISVEDGESGLDELRRSVEYLRGMREKYYPV